MNIGSGGLGGAIETVRPWLTTGFIGSILALLVKLYTDNRKLRMQAEKRAQEYQLEVTADGRSNLQFIIDNLRRDIERADGRSSAAEARAASAEERASKAETAHQTCEETLDQMHEERRQDRNRLDGLARQFVQFADSVSQGIPPGNWSPEITHMVDQLQRLGRIAREGLDTP